MRSGNGMGEPAAPARGHPSWQDVAAQAQAGMAGTLVRAIGEGRLDRHRYQHWLAMESALCRIDALVLDRLADWHATQPQLRATALGWATQLRDEALAAAADVRALDGLAAPPPLQLSRWHAYVEDACRSPRAGEALGTVLLHASLCRDAARDSVLLTLELPFLAQRGRAWLQRRCEPGPARHAQSSADLLAAWPASALAAGAQRAAAWHRDALALVLGLHLPVAAGDALPTVFSVAIGD